MGTLNVNRNVTDNFYRYKMPRIQAKVEGKGNGIKTVIVNMVEVAKAIGRPATYPTKYFGCELGAQTSWTMDRYIVNGSHDAVKLQDLLDGFIRKFVLCPECDNPETDLLVSAKKGTISQGCKACGFHGLLEVNHKVNTFILKNPPNGGTTSEGKRSKRSKRSGDTATTTNGDANSSAETPEVETVEATPKATKNNANNDDDDDAGWSVDVSEEAVRNRMMDLTEGAKNITITDDLERPEKQRIDMFYEEVKKRRDAGELENVQIHKELTTQANRLDIQAKAPLILAELLFTANIVQDVRKYRNLLLRFTHNDKKAQKYLIGGLEQTISLHADKMMDKVAGIFKLFYDLDILEEDVILEWAQKVSKKYVSKDVATQIHEKAAPFVKWLQDAEEEDDSEENDSDVEIVYNDRAPQRKETQTAVKKEAPKEDDGEDDIDIDDI